MKAGAFIGDDRTLVVISGPYERYVDPVLADLSKAVASLEVRLDALTESHQSKSSSGLDNEQRSNQERSLQRKGLRLGALAAGGTSLGDKENDQTRAPAVGASTTELVLDRLLNWSGNSIVQMALLVLVVAIAGAFVGAWLQSRMTGKNQEVWSVKTAGKQIVISRRDGSDAEGSVNLNVSRPLRSTGEQTFSSFADVKQYIDTITNGEDQGNGIPLGEGITEIAIGPGDTLKKLSQRYNSTPEQIMELNPNITKWTELQIGQKIVVPSSSSPNPAASP
jgi:LysM repeat protein